ncbi:hypothetical protein BN1723_007176 [Verticillium longisporum]|uniref:Uncharacterized protein n=1 Tax=Verticillium longisporum TaxID=100787 RepID=A0A0G4NJL7_VERLO|nr:hypothetical protein BN1723_007176 [Verticillium longisporum]
MKTKTKRYVDSAANAHCERTSSIRSHIIHRAGGPLCPFPPQTSGRQRQLPLFLLLAAKRAALEAGAALLLGGGADDLAAGLAELLVVLALLEVGLALLLLLGLGVGDALCAVLPLLLALALLLVLALDRLFERRLVVADLVALGAAARRQPRLLVGNVVAPRVVEGRVLLLLVLQPQERRLGVRGPLLLAVAEEVRQVARHARAVVKGDAAERVVGRRLGGAVAEEVVERRRHDGRRVGRERLVALPLLLEPRLPPLLLLVRFALRLPRPLRLDELLPCADRLAVRPDGLARRLEFRYARCQTRLERRCVLWDLELLGLV